MKWVCASMCAFVGSASIVGGAAAPTASELAQALQKKIDGVRDFSADFIHAYEGGVLKNRNGFG